MVVDAPGNPRYLTATCLQDPAAPTALERMEGRIFAGDVPIDHATAGPITIHAAAAVDDQALKDEVVVTKY